MGRDEHHEVGLAAVINQVREELEESSRSLAEPDGSGRQRLGFTLDKVTLEFTVQVRRGGSGRAGLRIGVVTADLGGTLDHATTHRIQVELLPGPGQGLVGR